MMIYLKYIGRKTQMKVKVVFFIVIAFVLTISSGLSLVHVFAKGSVDQEDINSHSLPSKKLKKEKKRKDLDCDGVLDKAVDGVFDKALCASVYCGTRIIFFPLSVLSFINKIVTGGSGF